MQVIMYKNDTGGISVIYPTPEALELFSIEEIAKKDVPMGVSFTILEKDTLPFDRFFRNAWIDVKDKIEIDLVKAKNLGHEFRRKCRQEEFAPLDVEATIPSKAQEAETKRQVIRDKYTEIQTNIDLADTPDKIKQALGLL